MAQLMERTQTERPRVVVVRRGMPPRRSTPHRDRALQELDLLLNATDREAFLEQTQKLTSSCVAAAQERLKPPEPKPTTLPPPPPSVVEAVSPLPLASVPRKPLPSSDALKGLSPGSALKKLRELRTEQNAPIDEEREVQRRKYRNRWRQSDSEKYRRYMRSRSKRDRGEDPPDPMDDPW